MRSEFDPVLRDGEKNASVARNGVRNKLKRTFGSLIFYCCFPKDMVTHKKRRRDREIEKRKFDPAEQSHVSHIKTPFGTSNTKESAPHLLFCRIYLPTCPSNSIQRTLTDVSLHRMQEEKKRERFMIIIQGFPGDHMQNEGKKLA